jgi:hypothetical protein
LQAELSKALTRSIQNWLLEGEEKTLKTLEKNIIELDQ